MAIAYRQPSVTVSETVNPTISPLLAAPALIGIVGLSQGFQTRTDQFALTGTTAIALPGLPAGATVTSVDSVKDAVDPSKGTNGSYTLTTDYTVQTAAGTITRVGAGGIADGAAVNVTYKYIPADYWSPIRQFDLGSVETRFGPSLDSTGTTINSPVSYAAMIAFENGADSVVIQPLFKRTTPGDPTSAPTQPDATQAAALSTWQDTFYAIRDIEDINVLVPIIGQSMTNVGDSVQLSIMQAAQDHVQFMMQQQQYLVTVLGEDASASNTVAQKATLLSHANTLRGRYGGATASSTVLVSPAKFNRALPSAGKTITLGGQYAAAAVAGALAARPVSSSLTRKTLGGFTQVAEFRDLQEKNTDAASGLMVIENVRGNVVVRHALTLDNTSTDRRELSVVRAKHRMIESVRQTLDDQVIGNLIADNNAPNVVASTVAAVLDGLVRGNDIVDYGGVDARYLSLDPTTIEVRFAYRPAMPVNYINIVFSLDLTTGQLTTDGSTSDILGGT
jgi:hypothetical protein